MPAGKLVNVSDGELMIEGTLSLVLPAHNEDENIGPVLESALDVLPRFVDEFEIIVVDDGSSDQTAEIVQERSRSAPQVRLISHPQNRGYGAALRSGFSGSSGDWVMVMDSDRQFNIGDLVYLEPLTDAYDLVAGYRIHRNDPLHRRLFGKTFRLAMRALFGVQLYDIDCAFKLIRGEMLRSLEFRSEGALVSTELMARWVRAGGSWTQVGVHHYPRIAGEQSGGSLRVILRAMRDVPWLWWTINSEPAGSDDLRNDSSVSTGISPAFALAIASILATVIGVALARLFRHRS